MSNETEDDGITFDQWKYIFWLAVDQAGMKLFLKNDDDLKDFYNDNLSPEDAINVIKVMCQPLEYQTKP